MHLPDGMYILSRSKAGHFVLHQTPVDIPDSDEMEQTQICIGQRHIQLRLRIAGLDITPRCPEQSVDRSTIEGFVLVVVVRIFEQIEELFNPVCPRSSRPERAVVVEGVERSEEGSERAVDLGNSSIVSGGREELCKDKKGQNTTFHKYLQRLKEYGSLS